MRIINLETKINAVKHVVDALELEENHYLYLGSFDNKFGIEYKVGSSIKDYHRFDMREILECIPAEALSKHESLRQYIFDMFMGSILTLVKNTKWAASFLSDKYFIKEDCLVLENFFKIVVAQPVGSIIRFDDVSLLKFIKNFKFDIKPCEFKGKYTNYNTLNLYTYSRYAAVRERDWIYLDNVFDTSSIWQSRMVIPSDMEKLFKGDKIGTLWFSDLTLLLKVKYRNVDNYISYDLPDELNEVCKHKKGLLWSYILDGLYSFADYCSNVQVSTMDNYVITTEVFENYALSFPSDSFNDKFKNVLSSMAN